MNKDFINPFLHSVLNVLATMARTEALPQKPQLKRDCEARGDVTGFIGMTGDRVSGSLAISFPSPVIFDICEKMLGEKVTAMDATVTDLVGEFTNMVTGGAKKLLGEAGYQFEMAIPSIVTGESHLVSHPHGDTVIMMPFQTETGTFFVEFAFRDER